MNIRDENIALLEQDHFDVLIIGGGINGAVSAAALAARGVKVGLIDSRDFAGFTSQHSSNLIWGGIKYMEGYEFPLVAGLCKSRNELMRSFPSTVKEIRFLTTLSNGFRYHPLMLLAGSWLYWLFGRCFTRTPRMLSAAGVEREEPIINTSNSSGGVEYSDAFLHDNDARFVFNFIRSALANGCTAANYVESQGSEANKDGGWVTRVRDQQSGKEFDIRSTLLINASGAYVDALNASNRIDTEHRHQLSKGIHLIVPQITANHRVLAFFADDGRLFFAIPMANRTCIGTTDSLVESAETTVSAKDRQFVLSNINARLDLPQPLTDADIIAERCGVRPLAVNREDDSEHDFLHLSRKHIVEVDTAAGHISIFGGKLTDCINVGEEICDKVAQLGVSLSEPEGKWYGEPGKADWQAYQARVRALSLESYRAEDTGESLATRLWRRYGNDAMLMLDRIETDHTLTEPVLANAGLYRCEVDYLAEREMIVTLEDLLRRRSKLELVLGRKALAQSDELMTLCQALFGEQASQRYREYFELASAEAKPE